MITTPTELYEAIDQFGLEPVVNHLNTVAEPATLVSLALFLGCKIDGAEIVHAAVERMLQLEQEAKESAAALAAIKQHTEHTLSYTIQSIDVEENKLILHTDNSALGDLTLTYKKPAPATPSKARKWNGSKWIRAEKRLAIYLRDSFLCAYCGKNLAAVRAKLRTLDHVTPVALGGSNDASNLATCCKRCNDRKQDRTASDFCTDDNRFQVLVEQLVKPLNVKLAKSIIEGTLDLSDVLEQVQ